MQYYPQQIKAISRMDQRIGDRGKRHYWGYEKGDYGFYMSEDQQYMRNLRSTRKQYGNQRLHTIDTSDFKQKQYETRDGYNNYQNKSSLKTVTKFNNPQQIRLPSISRASQHTQTDNYNSQKPKIRKIIEQDQRAFKQRDRINTQRAYCIENENNQQYVRKKPHIIQFDSRTRFSPTFVCSLRNPLPSYSIEPRLYNPLTYVRSESLNQKTPYRKF